MNIYQTTHKACCPNGDLSDTYEVTIKSQSTIMVEDILAALKSCPEKIYQEDFATYLRSKLGAEITVTGWHHGIFVTTIRK